MIDRVDLEALRDISLFTPDVRTLKVTLDGGEGMDGFGANRDRAAEVLFVPYRASGEVLLITKATYPPSAYRLPTGGVQPGELPQQAAARELYEECGYRLEAPGLLGVVQYEIRWSGVPAETFISYIFLAPVPADQPPEPTDPNERIVSYRWIPVAGLASAAARLRRLPTSWHHWGQFRSASYSFISEAIVSYNRSLEMG